MSQTPSTDDDSSEEAAWSDPKWLRYEKDVADFLSKFDPGAEVRHNEKILGVVSGRERQVDVWASGDVVGMKMTVAVECKRYKNKLGIGKIDEFAGKLEDVGAQSGIVYAYSGVTEGAQARADGAGPVRIEIRDLSVSVATLHSWSDDLHELVGFDCENENCLTGSVMWLDWPQEDGESVEAGSCDSCGTWTVRCRNCETTNAFFWDEVECEGCGAKYEQVWGRKRADVEDIVALQSDDDEIA